MPRMRVCRLAAADAADQLAGNWPGNFIPAASSTEANPRHCPVVISSKRNRRTNLNKAPASTFAFELPPSSSLNSSASNSANWRTGRRQQLPRRSPTWYSRANTGGAFAPTIRSSRSCVRAGAARGLSVHFPTARAPQSRSRQAPACCRLALVEAAVSEHGPVEGGTASGMKACSRSPGGCLAIPRSAPTLAEFATSDGGFGRMAFELRPEHQ
jgi:hypothetical protein